MKHKIIHAMVKRGKDTVKESDMQLDRKKTSRKGNVDSSLISRQNNELACTIPARLKTRKKSQQEL